MKNKAIFLDRDGTIIQDRGYICHLFESEIFPFAYEAVRIMNENQFKVIGITNQSSIARGICSPEQVETLHLTIREKLQVRQALIEKFYYCPYHADGEIPAYKKEHPWRKPSPGMLIQAARDFNIQLSHSYMMGDNLIDIQAGKNAGCRTVLVLTGKGLQTKEKLEKENINPDLICKNILTAIKEIINI